MIQTEDLRRMLDDAYDQATIGDLPRPLREQLRANEATAGALVSAGSLSSVSKNAASHSYAFGYGQVTTAELARGWRTLIDLFDSTATDLASSVDATIKAEMMRRLQPIREFTKDFTCLNYA